MRIGFVFILLLVLPTCGKVFSQLSTKNNRAAGHYYAARDLYTAKRDKEAADRLKQAISIDRNFIEAYLLLGEVYSELKSYPQAINALKHAITINPDFFPNTFFNLAYIYLLTQDFENAKQYFEIFVKRKDIADSSREKAYDYIQRCEFAIYAMRHPVDFFPVNLGDSINTRQDEYWPSLTADEELLVFTRQVLRDPFGGETMRNKREDFYTSRRVDGYWTGARDLGPPINTDRNEGAQSLSADGRFMYFTACNREDSYGSCDIYVSVREGDRWSIPVNLGPPVNSAAWEAQPSISPDGRTLYFVCNRGGGYGGMDLWKSTLNENGLWSSPVNLGKNINTSGDEMSPFIHADNKTLYFSSNGLIGLGSMDLFKTEKAAGGDYAEPVNLGYPINTPGDETGLIVSAAGNMAYFASDRLEGAGKDIFMFELHEEARPVATSYMKGIVFDAATNKKLRARFELIDLDSEELTMTSVSDNRSGEFLVPVPTNRNYALNVSRPDYLFFSENFTLKGISTIVEPFLMDIPLQKILPGEKVVLRNIFFDFDKSEIKPDSYVELEKLVQFLKDNPVVKIRINGHTDNVGSAEYNLRLSDQRAAAVVKYLSEKGIVGNRISSRGYGSTQPVDTNETPEGRARNRRTEFEVM